MVTLDHEARRQNSSSSTEEEEEEEEEEQYRSKIRIDYYCRGNAAFSLLSTNRSLHFCPAPRASTSSPTPSFPLFVTLPTTTTTTTTDDSFPRPLSLSTAPSTTEDSIIVLPSPDEPHHRHYGEPVAQGTSSATPSSSAVPQRSEPSRHSIFRIEKNKRFSTRRALQPQPRPSFLNPLNTTPRFASSVARSRTYSETTQEYPLLPLPPQRPPTREQSLSNLAAPSTSDPVPPTSTRYDSSPHLRPRGYRLPPVRSQNPRLSTLPPGLSPIQSPRHPPMATSSRSPTPVGIPLPNSPSLSQSSNLPPTPPAKDTPPLPALGKRTSPVTNPVNRTVVNEPSASATPAIPRTPRQDLERGPPLTPNSPFTPRRVSDGSVAWNSSHPCYPHPNPHVPLSSPLFKSTRVIRVQRDWMVDGDLYPAFSNTYPEILSPWIREADFRRLIENVNDGLKRAFEPRGVRSWMDAVLGAITGFIWDDFGAYKSKKGVRAVERFVQEWNEERRRENLTTTPREAVAAEAKEDDSEADPAEVVRCVELRRTGFLCLDFVIPDPKVAVVGSEADGGGTRPTTRPTTAGLSLAGLEERKEEDNEDRKEAREEADRQRQGMA